MASHESKTARNAAQNHVGGFFILDHGCVFVGPTPTTTPSASAVQFGDPNTERNHGFHEQEHTLSSQLTNERAFDAVDHVRHTGWVTHTRGKRSKE